MSTEVDRARGLERDSLEFLDKELFTDVTAGSRHEADLLVKARWQGRESYFLIHVEHQATRQRDFNKRMFRYFARLYEKFDLPIYPVVIFSYDKPRSAEPESLVIGFPDLAVLDFRYRVIQLNRLSWRDYVRNPNPVASALMARMDIAPDERAQVKLECLRLLVTLKLDPARMQMIAGFVDTYLELNRQETVLFQRALEKEKPRQREEVMEITGNWMKEGWNKGLTQGLKQGLKQGHREEAMRFTSRLLQRRVGEVPVTVQKRVDKLSLAKLESLGEALLDFQSLADLRAWLKNNG